MESTSNTAAYWIAGIIVVLAIILGAWLLAGGSGNSAGVPNTGAQQTTTGSTGTGSGMNTTGTGY